MAGTIVADTLQNGAGTSTTMDNAIYGSAKAWAQWSYASGSTCTINKSYNVSSITVNGSTNDFTINFTNALSTANYVIVGSGGQGSGNLNAICVPAQSSPPTTSAVRVNNVYQNGSFAGSNTYNSVACIC